MPWTLYRFIVVELIKLLAMASLVLVLLVSTAVAIKPLIDGFLEPGALLRFVALMAPTMLQFALPFAAALASTLVFSRMTADNEIMACSAGGLSYLSLFLPVLYLGLLLMLGLFHLSNSIAPAFNQQAAAVIQKDIIRVMVNQLEQGQAFKTGRTVIYADSAVEHQPTTEEIQRVLDAGSRVPPFRAIVLQNAAVGILGDQSRIVREGTARTANIYLFRDGRRTFATAYLEDVSYYDALRGDLLYVRQSEWAALPIDTSLRDRPQFLSRNQLRQLAANPDRFDRVSRARQQLLRAMARSQLILNIEASLKQEGQVVELMGMGEEQYRIYATGFTRTENGLDLRGNQAGAVRIEMTRSGGIVRHFIAESVRIGARQDEFDMEPWAIIELVNTRVLDPRSSGRGTEHATLTLPALRWPQSISNVHQQAPLETLGSIAQQNHPHDNRVVTALMQLQDESVRLLRELSSQLHIRGASAVTCLLVLTLGALLAIRMQGRSPLVVYFWSFMLTLLVVIMTHAGRSVCMDTRLPLTVGAGTIWLGNAALAGVLGWQFMLLRRH
ncbi:MAG: LptF/LptG family permease [Phycisphaerales bacterium]|nr:LptF/LptG family permease [Phycisphaerales bacterium]